MRLTSKSGVYKSPQRNQGIFNDAYIEDIGIVHKRKENYLSVTFAIMYMQDGKEIMLSKAPMVFTNDHTELALVKIPNADYDESYAFDENTPQEDYDKYAIPFFIEPLMPALVKYNGVLPDDSTITEYGYPTYDVVKTFFDGGSTDDPELTVSNPIAIGFLLNKLIINGEPAGLQFTID